MPRKGRTQRRRRTANVLANPFRGTIITPTMDPPQINKTPWYRVTLLFEDAYSAGTAYQLLPNNIKTRLGNQFGIPANSMPELVFKMRSVFVWSVADATSQSVSVEVDISSLVPTVSDNANPTAPRAVFYGTNVKLVDTGTLNKPAAVGYKYSLQDRSVIISTSQSFALMQYAAGGGGYLRLQLHILFSFAGDATPPPNIQSAVPGSSNRNF